MLEGGLVLLMLAVGIGVVILALYIGMYNALVGKRNAVANVFATMDVMLKKRYDLIPNLVASVKEYTRHEAETLEKVTAQRAKMMADGNLSDNEKVELDNQISQAVRGIMVAVEAYPQLRANENFLMLQRSLNEVEEQISASRRAYNATVTDYNNALEMFPSSVVASIHHFERKNWFEIVEAERQAPQVAAMFAG